MSHSSAAMQASLRETLDGIDASFALLGGRLEGAGSLRLRAIQAALIAIPTDDIFAGRLRRGWYGYSFSLRKRPFLTIFQPKTAILLARTALGERGFNVSAWICEAPGQTCARARSRSMRPYIGLLLEEAGHERAATRLCFA